MAGGRFSEDSPFLERHMFVEATERHLPHWQVDGGFYFVTWRLADALPNDQLRQWAAEKSEWLREHPQPWDAATREAYQNTFPRRLEEWLDAGCGECVLRQRTCAAILAEVLHRFDGQRYALKSFVIMPNHVHVLFRLLEQAKLDKVLQGWKGVSARRINEHLGRGGTLWRDESYDTCIRNPGHLQRAHNYIQENPLKAHLREGEYLYFESPTFREELREWIGDFDPQA